MEDHNNMRDNNKKHRAVTLFITLLAIVFFVDVFTNLITGLCRLPCVTESLLDGFLIILFAYPALYFFIFKPLTIEISERKHVEKLKDEFIGTVSHELRTPLSITKEGISLLLDKIPGPINEDQARILTISKNNMDRLARIINSLLDISRIESGKIQICRDTFDIILLTTQVVNVFEPNIRKKGLEVRADLPKKDIIVRGDSDGITIVLTNLISNSLKFTERGFIGISVTDSGENVEISVADTGIGIAKDNMPKLFEKFQQFARVDGPGEKGTGLGLAIASGIVAAHKGRIWAESEPDKGTRITFTLPKNV